MRAWLAVNITITTLLIASRIATSVSMEHKTFPSNSNVAKLTGIPSSKLSSIKAIACSFSYTVLYKFNNAIKIKLTLQKDAYERASIVIDEAIGTYADGTLINKEDFELRVRTSGEDLNWLDSGRI